MSENLTLQQVAEKVGRTPQTLRMHIRKQWLKAEKLPRRRLTGSRN